VRINYSKGRAVREIDTAAMREDIQNTMSNYVGITRNKEGLLHAWDKVERYYTMIQDMKNESIKDFELQNILLLSRLVIESALQREESRGAHYRSDFNKPDDINWRTHIIKKGTPV